jgi:hypothetical protein
VKFAVITGVVEPQVWEVIEGTAWHIEKCLGATDCNLH